MASDSGDHRAWCAEEVDGRWSGGCNLCGTYFSGAEKLGAQSWVSGHDSSIVSTRRVAEKVGPRFEKVGPGDACTIQELREALDWVSGNEAEILTPADSIPALFLWTPAAEEGWNREFLGSIHLERGAQYVPFTRG